MKHHILPILLFPAVAVPQTVHEIPFASSGNIIELTVANTSQISQYDLRVKVVGFPLWLRCESEEHIIADLPGGEEGTRRFTFSVDKSAPVNIEHILTFTVSGRQGQSWTRSMIIKVSPPQSLELFQNYPNPFNPTTTIGYQLPLRSYVRLTVYTLLGQEVATLVNGDRDAGFHEELWDASSVSSGLYLYRLTGKDRFGKDIVRGKTLVVVK